MSSRERRERSPFRSATAWRGRSFRNSAPAQQPRSSCRRSQARSAQQAASRLTGTATTCASPQANGRSPSTSEARACFRPATSNRSSSAGDTSTRSTRLRAGSSPPTTRPIIGTTMASGSPGRERCFRVATPTSGTWVMRRAASNSKPSSMRAAVPSSPISKSGTATST